MSMKSASDNQPTTASNTSSARHQSHTVSVRPVSTRAELQLALTVRERVFVGEFGIPRTQEFDAFDGWPVQDGITHFLVSAGRFPVATCRVNTLLSTGAKLEHLVVDKGVRRRGIGKALLAHIERTSLVKNLKGSLSAIVVREQEPFYKKLGWVVEQGHDKITIAGFPHVTMINRRRPRGCATEPSLSHVMIKTTDIERAQRFYSLLGYQDVRRFRTAGVRAAWIESPYIDQRIELLEVKTVIRPDDPSLLKVSSMTDYSPGMGHICMDVSRACTDLTKFLVTVQHDSVGRFRMGLRMLQKPKQMMMGSLIVEVAFITDADGTILELMRINNKLERKDLDEEW